jgi:endonuclease V-like protein UPF0215 family
MGFLIKTVMVVIVLGGIVLAGYAYLGDLAPAAQEVKVPVVLHGE